MGTVEENDLCYELHLSGNETRYAYRCARVFTWVCICTVLSFRPPQKSALAAKRTEYNDNETCFVERDVYTNELFQDRSTSEGI